MTDKQLRILVGILALAVLAFHYGYKGTPDEKEVRNIQRYIAKGAFWVGKYPPDFTATQLDGGRFSLAEQVGKKTIVLNFFATWCGPCVEELPELNRFYLEHRDEGFVLVGIDVEEKEDLVRSFVGEHHLGYPVIADSEGALKKLFGVESFPTSVFIGADGKIALYEMGGLANADVTFAGLLRESRASIAAGKGIAQAVYLEAQKNQKLEPPSTGEEKPADKVVLEGRSLKIAERMQCVCGCEHKLLECTCSTGTKMKQELKALKADDPRSDEEIIRQIDKQYCVGSKP